MILTLRRRKGQDYECIIPSIWILELHHYGNKASEVNFLQQSSVSLLSSVCANDWILALHQTLLILLIIGKWLLPLGGGVTREELSHLLLIFVGTAADILEFTSETLSDVKDTSPKMVYVILGVWTLSLVQFPLHLSVASIRSSDDSDDGQNVSRLVRLRKDVLSMVESLLIQDGPFLVVRLTVIFYFKVIHQMLIFFSIKNFLVVILNVYRLTVTGCNYKASLG
ncbi:hypothetical protein DPEC_G00032160 [Dallia pectoralis]|uniref:Uncharacterized protein n=1 Tax=Dallia pectoralis TaxID=75939 RepID=A0ACC2HD54_DALPE|nr:hypothetical protein DPEC_G00032160 [Dallia pectoralis]